MPLTVLPRLLVALAALALCACTDSPSTESDPIGPPPLEEPPPPEEPPPEEPPPEEPPPEEPPPSAQARDFYQVYVDESRGLGTHSLVLVNAGDFTERIPLGLASTNFAGTFATLDAGTRDGDVIRDLRPHSLYYTQDNAWQKVSLRHEGSQTPVRLSSDSLAGLCAGRPYLLAPQLGSSVGAQLLYVLAGPDTGCYTDDDVFRRVPVDASPTSLPEPGVQGWPMVEFRDDQGELTGLLVGGSGGVHLYDASLAQGTLLTSVPSHSGRSLSMSRDEALVVLIDGSVHRVDADATITELLPARPDAHVFAVNDATHAFAVSQPFAAGENTLLYRISRDGLEPASLIWETDQRVFPLATTSESIILMVGEYGHQDLRLLPKTADGTQAPQPIAGVPAGLLDFVGRGMPLLFNVADAAYRLDADGTLTTYPTSAWLGFQHSADASVSTWPFHGYANPVATDAFRIDGFDPAHRHLNGTIRLIDLESDVARDITQVATEEYVRAFGARGSLGMGLFWEGQFDIFSFDLDDDRFVRHTDGTSTNETEFSY